MYTCVVLWEQGCLLSVSPFFFELAAFTYIQVWIHSSGMWRERFRKTRSVDFSRGFHLVELRHTQAQALTERRVPASTGLRGDSAAAQARVVGRFRTQTRFRKMTAILFFLATENGFYQRGKEPHEKVAKQKKKIFEVCTDVHMRCAGSTNAQWYDSGDAHIPSSTYRARVRPDRGGHVVLISLSLALFLSLRSICGATLTFFFRKARTKETTRWISRESQPTRPTEEGVFSDFSPQPCRGAPISHTLQSTARFGWWERGPTCSGKGGSLPTVLATTCRLANDRLIFAPVVKTATAACLLRRGWFGVILGGVRAQQARRLSIRRRQCCRFTSRRCTTTTTTVCGLKSTRKSSAPFLLTKTM